MDLRVVVSMTRPVEYVEMKWIKANTVKADGVEDEDEVWMGVDDRPSKQSFRGKRGSAKKSPSTSAAGREKCTVAQLGLTRLTHWR